MPQYPNEHGPESYARFGTEVEVTCKCHRVKYRANTPGMAGELLQHHIDASSESAHKKKRKGGRRKTPVSPPTGEGKG